MAGMLKLIALDATDLTILSAHTQDAAVNVAEIAYDSNLRQLAVPMRRYVWEAPGARRWLFPRKERRLALLHFNKVSDVRSTGFDLEAKDKTLVLLAVQFQPSAKDDDLSGTVNLVFAGDAQMAFSVETIEAQLVDTGAAWSAQTRPRHKGSGEG